MSNNFKKAMLKKYIKYAAKVSDREYAEVEEDMCKLKQQYNVSFFKYAAHGMHNLRYGELKVRYGGVEDLDIALVAEIRGTSYEKEQAVMDRLRDKYGIMYKEFTDNKMYLYKNSEDLNRRVKRYLENEKKYIAEISADSGWSLEKSKKEAHRAKMRYGVTSRKYSRYRFYAMGDEEIAEKMRRWTKDSKNYVRTVRKESGWTSKQVKAHMKRYSVLYDIIRPYYVLYRAWELSDEEMDSYARQKNSETIWAKHNDKAACRILAEKHRFDEVYKDYIGRKFWVNRDTDFEEFSRFAEGVDYVFCKPIESGGGLGTEKHEVNDPRTLYDMLMSKERLLVEECIKQHPEVDEFVPGCVCTIRVVVIRQGDEVHTICAGMRFGHSTITDNFSHDGMVADIDIETGTIITDAIDKKGHIYDVHPVSGKRFKGFKIPNWDKVREVTEKAMFVQNGVNYVGWDVAICEDKAVLVEGNAMPDLVLIQAPYAPVKKGMKYLFTPYMED